MRNLISIIILTLVLAVSLVCCDLNSFAPALPLHPPLALELESSNQMIIAKFWAFNDEEFFSGYNVYMANTEEEVSLRTRSQALLNPNTGDLPSYTFGKSSEVHHRVLEISHDPAGNPLLPGSTWFLSVSAWDYRFQTNSALGEILSIEIE